MPIDTDKDRGFNDGDGDEPDDDNGAWCLHIVRAANGFIVDGSACEVPAVFEDGDDVNANGVDPDAFARLLDFITEYYGAVGSRYDARRIRVIVEPGDKHSPKIN